MMHRTALVAVLFASLVLIGCPSDSEDGTTTPAPDTAQPDDDTGAVTDTKTDEDVPSEEDATATGDTPQPPACPAAVTCAAPPPTCPEGLVVVQKGDCWGCGFPDTCSCDDGTLPTCAAEPPECGPGMELVARSGCHACVDPFTCLGAPTAECNGNEDCVSTPYKQPVTSEAQCYCPKCGVPATNTVAAANMASWLVHCTEWEKESPCSEVDCGYQGPTVCKAGACIFMMNACPGEVACDEAKPQCPQGLVPVVVDACWGCGFPETCSCSDGQPVTCKMLPPTCPEGTVLAEQDACYVCADPKTCKPPKVPVQEKCTTDADCTDTEVYAFVDGPDDCYCPKCPTVPVTQSVAGANLASWQEHCTGWVAQNPCPEIDCQDPGPTLCKAETCVFVKDACPGQTECNTPPPACPDGLIPVVKEGCWGCGYPQTCSCSDGPAICPSIPPQCPEGTELAEQGGCFECVDPMTCKLVAQ